MRARSLLLALTLSGLAVLQGCGPKTLMSSLFPLRYTVRSDVTFVDGGRATVQSGRTTCAIVDESDSLGGTMQTRANGGAHWLKRADGSILILGVPSPCRWFQTAPNLGDSEVFDPVREQRGLGNYQSYLFASATDPSVVDVVSTSALFDRSNDPAIAQETFTVVDGDATQGLSDAFPGNAILGRDGKLGVSESGLGAPLIWPRYFVGVNAQVWKLDGPSPCDTGDGKPTALPLDQHCDEPMTCVDGQTPSPPSVCGELLGHLIFKPAPGFARMDATLAIAPSPMVTMRLYKSSLVVAAVGASQRFWSPSICVDDLCTVPAGMIHEAILYFPKRRILVKVFMESQTVGPFAG